MHGTKRALALTGAAAIAAASTATAQIYIQGYGGVGGAIESDIDATFSNGTITDTTNGMTMAFDDLNGESLTISSTGDASTVFGGAIGYNFDEILFGRLSPRVEIDLSRATSAIDELTVPADGDVITSSVSVPSSDREMTVIALRAILEIDTPALPIDPYIGASVGQATFDDYLSGFGEALGATSISAGDATAYGAFGGATLALPSGLAVYGELRYQRVSDVEISVRGLDYSLTGSDLIEVDLDGTTDIDNLTGLVGLRWEF